MIKYIKENLDSISKLFINHIGMMIFALVVLITSKLLSTKIGNDAVFYIAGIITVLMYFSLIYTAMWERGASDKIKIDGGRLSPNLLNGLWLYLLGNALFLVTSVLSLLFSFFVTEDASFANNAYAVFRFISHYYNAMYMPITNIAGLGAVAKSFIYVGTILPGAVVSLVSYILGVKGFKCLFPEPKRDKNKKTR
ncbi:MAG: hypothetical protein E7596_05905 [Ruminococcaceae bacterium]|nr:hypothetical protein [Oscillospiraceae bacterium]